MFTRRVDIVVAGHAGDTATARRALDDGDPSVRAAALGALARLGDLNAEELKRALTDVEPVVRSRAVEVTPLVDSSTGQLDSRVSLKALLDDPVDQVVETVSFVCGERIPPEPGIVEPLAAIAVGHTDPLCREAAVAALGAIGNPAGLEAILAATKDKPAIRRRAVLALAPFDGPEVRAALELALSDRDWQVRQAAEDLSEET